MGNPFKDQFLKKGLVTKKQANKASHEQRLSAPKKRNKKMQEADGVQEKIRQARQEQAARDRELHRLILLMARRSKNYMPAKRLLML